MGRSLRERSLDCSSKPWRRSSRWRRFSRGRSCTRCPGCSRSDAGRRFFIVPLHADASIRQQTALFGATPFVIWNAFVTVVRVPTALHSFESRLVHAFRSIHGRNYQTRESCRAVRESQKSSGYKRMEPAKHRSPVPEWKQSPERKQSSSWRLAKTRFRAAFRGLASRLGPSQRPLVEWSPMLLH